MPLTKVFVKAGLDNVTSAMFQPFGLDLCSGVRTDKKLDPYKLEKFFESMCK